MNIYPYKNGSEGAKALANALGIKQIKREGSKFRGSGDKLVINWGSSDMNEEVSKCKVLNKPEAVALASNKLSFFRRIEEVNKAVIRRNQSISIPKFFTDIRNAREYFNAGYTLVCRTILNGHSGAGIVLANNDTHTRDQIPECPLYVLYMPKKSEYRIHVLDGKVVDIQKKVRRMETPDDQVNWKIRNHDNGFIYARNEVAENTPKQVCEDSIKAITACGLDFGAVDVIYNEKNDLGYVLEINTAPGLTGETLEGYRKRFEEIGTKFKETKKLSSHATFNVDDFTAAGIPVEAQAVPVTLTHWPRLRDGRIDYDEARRLSLIYQNLEFV